MFGKPLHAPVCIGLGAAVVDFELREVRREGAVARLEPRAADVLFILAGAGGRVLTRSDLLDACWPNGSGSDEALTQAVAQIRRALGDNSRSPIYLQTVPKGGYRIVPEVTALDERQATCSGRGDASAVEQLVGQGSSTASAAETQRRQPLPVGKGIAFASLAIAAAVVALSLLPSRELEEIVIVKGAAGSSENGF